MKHFQFMARKGTRGGLNNKTLITISEKCNELLSLNFANWKGITCEGLYHCLNTNRRLSGINAISCTLTKPHLRKLARDLREKERGSTQHRSTCHVLISNFFLDKGNNSQSSAERKRKDHLDFEELQFEVCKFSKGKIQLHCKT